MALELGTNPTQCFGIDRSMIAYRVSEWLFDSCANVEFHIELGDLAYDVQIAERYKVGNGLHSFCLALADRYLDWLYAQYATR